MGDAPKLSGPDLETPFPIDQLVEGKPFLGRVGDEGVIVVRQGTAIFATGATCTHYGAPLAEGAIDGQTVRCPWHHACFDLRTGDAIGGPAINPLPCFDVVRDGNLIKIGKAKKSVKRTSPTGGPASVAIVGAGPAGTACAVALRADGYLGTITVVGAEQPGPVDRPNLSKDYLAGTAPEEWIPLRTREQFAAQSIELVADDEVTSVDLAARKLALKSGRTVAFGALVLAPGAEAIRLAIPGADLPHVHVLRTLADARAIIDGAKSAKRAVVVGSSFIGLEAAASLRARGLDVTVVGPDAVPLARVLGDEVGTFVRGVHEANGTKFRLGTKPAKITPTEVVLEDGTSLPAELVVTGVGVRPRTALAESMGLALDRGIVVDESFKTAAQEVYAIGDVARYPWDGSSVRIEHFAVAVRHGQQTARRILGRASKGGTVPFFWSQHHDVTLSYVGHAERFERPIVVGNLAERDAIVGYREDGKVKAILTIGRDRASLEAELAFESGDQARLEALLR
jgi:NADPH-dependent 2,4-dienoyl-CoA reductase/sulfur reductase-like enzyme/nitrite reductase/ring-hydroxylating ferredoxin subunit